MSLFALAPIGSSTFLASLRFAASYMPCNLSSKIVEFFYWCLPTCDIFTHAIQRELKWDWDTECTINVQNDFPQTAFQVYCLARSRGIWEASLVVKSWALALYSHFSPSPFTHWANPNSRLVHKACILRKDIDDNKVQFQTRKRMHRCKKQLLSKQYYSGQWPTASQCI